MGIKDVNSISLDYNWAKEKMKNMMKPQIL